MKIHMKTLAIEKPKKSYIFQSATPSQAIEFNCRLLMRSLDRSSPQSYLEQCRKILDLSNLVLDKRFRGQLVSTIFTKLSKYPVAIQIETIEDVLIDVWKALSHDEFLVDFRAICDFLSRYSFLMEKILSKYGPESKEATVLYNYISRSGKLLSSTWELCKTTILTEKDTTQLINIGKRLKEINLEVWMKYPSHLQPIALLSESEEDNISLIYEGVNHNPVDIVVLFLHFPKILSEILKKTNSNDVSEQRMINHILWRCFGVIVSGVDQTEILDELKKSYNFRSVYCSEPMILSE
ncbi:uncharacterized protein LOC136033174 [Artemia franciscana]|uniref:Uncharacterized protein n=1 Tax=Artemia franciscana TaxID=6661 RepID=A0AA88LCF6_ARTSF|nr:hypothetical protein QYM36_001642 [Artemia franciscana]